MPKKFIVEAIGTFFLVFTVGQCVITPGAGNFAPIAIGASLMIMVYAGGHVSGGLYNPAVALSVFLRGKLPARQWIADTIAEFLGAALAVAAVTYLKNGHSPIPAELHAGPTILAEFLFTFALTFVVLNVATVDSVAGNSYYGLAIGSTVMVGAFAVGGSPAGRLTRPWPSASRSCTFPTGGASSIFSLVKYWARSPPRPYSASSIWATHERRGAASSECAA